MFNIQLFKYNKKPNSTAVPSSSGTTFPCLMKTVASIQDPIIDIKTNASLCEYNYAYIPQFKRYYFVDDVSWDLGIWSLSLRVDVLASFRTDIRRSKQYVLRSASQSDGSIVDNMYPTKGSSTKVRSYATGHPVLNGVTTVATYFDGILFTGCFVLQVASNNSSGITAYAMDNAAFKSLIGNLFNYVPDDMEDISDGVSKQLFDPMQYIMSCQWFPNFPDKSGTAVTAINFGGYNISVSGDCRSFDPTAWDDVTIDITVPKHPDIAAYPYMQLEPYSRYSLYFEPFGSMNLDSTKLYGVTTVQCRWYVEYQKGYVHLDVVDRSNSSNVIYRADSILGVSIPVTQLTSDLISTGSNILSGAGNVLGNLLTGNIVGAIGSAVGAIGNGVSSMIPNVQTKGTPDSFLIYRGENPVITAQFMNVVDRDNARLGSPLCASRTLSNLSGFVVCQESAVNYSAGYPTRTEAEQVTDLLDSGVYLE